MSKEINRQKIVVGLTALLSTLVAAFLWILKLKYKKQIGVGILILITGVAISLWIWYANLPSWNDVGDKTYDQIDQSWSTVTKGDLK